jgi:ABC-type transport system involved in cytochrome c biogenesis permease subunit
MRRAALLISAGLFSLVCGLALVPPRDARPFRTQAFAELPVLNGGRIKPLDTVARTALLMLSGKQSVRAGEETVEPARWLLDMLFRPAVAAHYACFAIDDPDVLGLIGIQQTTQRRFSFNELAPKLMEISRQAAQAQGVKADQRTRFQSAVVNLEERLTLYQKLENTVEVAGTTDRLLALQDFDTRLNAIIRAHRQNPKAGLSTLKPLVPMLEQARFTDQVAEFFPIPLDPDQKGGRSWVSLGNGLLLRIQSSDFHPGVVTYAAIADSWRNQDAKTFNRALIDYRAWLDRSAPREARRARFEWVFNYFAPFYQSLLLYLLVFLLILASWLTAPGGRTSQVAWGLLVFTFALHTFGLLSRMALQGRPPVTNLYSSAIFVGWVAVLLGIVLERIYRNGIGALVAAAIGFITLIIAHHLAATGDTLEMMRAVLDSNFWLATHVVCITVGYGSTFLSGFLATVYILRRRWDRSWNAELGQTLERMVYGVVCFSTLFSFVGTVLGGIWADQSWGRFWGWDPKENGALMIVLWNVFILHARWGGYTDAPALMRLAVVGNIVTALSWFGVNMLGIGLHSYGWMDKAFVWLLLFILSQLMIIALGYWRHRPKPLKHK